MPELNTFNLHDSVFERLAIDAQDGRIEVYLDYYRHESAVVRVPATLVFEGVSAHSLVMDFEQMAVHRNFGNVSDWKPAPGGTSFLFMAGGCLCVTAERVMLQHRSSPG